MATNRQRLGPGESSLSPDLIAQRGFASARRGFDPDEVKAFLAQVAEEVRGMRQREASLERALGDAEDRAAHPSIDENTLMAAVGEETARILRSAHAAAHDIRTKAEDNASRILKEAHDRATVILGEAETVLARRTTEAEAMVARITEAGTTDAERLRSAGQRDAEALRAQAEAERKLTLDAAHGARERILNDLSRRRNVAVVQIDQLRAGRERLLEAYKVVRRTLDEVTGELQRADAEARAAADAAGRRSHPPEADDTVPVADAMAPAGPGTAGPERAQPGGRVPPPAAGTDARGSEPSAASPEGADHGSRPPTAPGPPGDDAQPPSSADRSGTGVVAPRRLTSLKVGRRQKELKERIERPAAPPRPVNGEGPMAEGPAPSTTSLVESTSASPPAGGAGPTVAGSAPEAMVDDDGGSVGDLFARIRADREESVGEARQILDTDSVPPETRLAGAAAWAQSDRVTNEDEVLLQRRDEAIGPIEASLARKLKRALQDEQNDLLDRLRGLRAKPTAALVLPAIGAHAERFSAAGRPLLDQAAKAGAAFAASLSGQAPSPKHAETADLDDLAADLAGAVIDPLRRRLEQAFSDGGDDDDPGVLVESLGAAYREWKTQRIEQTAADQIAAAFARGAFAATAEGTRLRWLVEDANGPCPDCDDNALAGAIPKGEPFPTGQRWPPAHAGCRCLLVPEPG
jgi:DivIVA domain-containing protein